MAEESKTASNFIKNIIDSDLAEGKNQGRVITRFPPEPNGYLHIGHAKSICLNFGLAAEYNGPCHLRFDDSNPTAEDVEYVESIKEDVHWLGFDWGENLFFASDYFEAMFQYAQKLIKDGKAYVCSLSADEIKDYRGSFTEAGKESPYRDRPIDENLELFQKMRAGEFADGELILRAKIDMSSGNINMRDPAIYRIRHEHHHRTGDQWCIYPMYDYCHCLSDSIETITHSICTLEFEDHRPLYDWILDELEVPCHPQQIEFARLNITFTVLSKRRLLELVEGKHVDGWDDPRMPTIAGMRRRGYTAAAIRDFCDRIGVAKADSIVDIELLNFCLREDLNKTAKRVMAVLDPLKVVIENYPEGSTEELEAKNNPEDPEAGTRKVPFSRELYIERSDFMENPSKKFRRLAPGKEVRFLHAYYITCNEAIKDETTGEVLELRCTYDPETRGGWSEDGRKVKGTVHWVSAQHAKEAEVRLFSHLFAKENPNDTEPGQDYKDFLNPESQQTIDKVLIEPSLVEASPGERFQFVRNAYFCADAVESTPGKPVFNRIVELKSSFKPAAN